MTWILRARSQVLLCLFKGGGVGEYEDGEGALSLMETNDPISCWLHGKCPLSWLMVGGGTGCDVPLTVAAV